MIYALKVVNGQERVVVEMFYNEVRKMEEQGKSKGIYSVLYAPTQKGYIFVETEKGNYRVINEIAKMIPKAKKVVGGAHPGEVTIEEIENIIFPKKVITSLNKGDYVEVISGAFKGEKARVVKINKEKNEVTVELVEAAVPIPVTFSGSDLILIKEDEEKKKE